MPPRNASARPFRTSHAALLASVSALTLLASAPAGRAGNILVPGGATPAVTAATASALAASQQAAAMAAQAQNSLARATLAIQAMQAAQSAARNLALAGTNHLVGTLDVPSGLSSAGAGGLVPDSGLAAPGIANPVTSWTGADTPTQSGSNGRTTVDIQQTAAQAILNWKTFNVSKDTTVQFDQQGNASWVALNRIQDPSGVPSQILGQIKADGSVYLINRNGIIFGGSSQVNAHALIASSADIDPDHFLATGIYSTQSGGAYIPSFTDAGGLIQVEAGAQIGTDAPESVTQGGGFVLLMGTQVRNAGSITTPQGQTELAAGDDFILRPGYSTEGNQGSTTRGNEIASVLHADSASGAVANAGLIYAQQGDITLAGHAITQDGVLLSTTSVNTRGTIHLLNSASDATGGVTLTGNSLTLIAPELDSTDTALDSQRDALIAASGFNTLAKGQFDNLSTLTDRRDQSRIEIVAGGTVEFQGNSQTKASGGQVAVSAGKRVQVDADAVIDVSGSWGVALPMSANEIEISRLQPNDLRDDPNNRDSGVLTNSDVYVDARDLMLVPAGTGGYTADRYYTNGGVLEVSGYLGNTAHTIGEWTAIGGTITLAGNEVVAQPGSIFNIAGGSIQYQSGNVRQSYLIGNDGRIYNINTAPAYITYTGIYNGFVVDHPRWGVTETYRSPLIAPAQIFQEGYLVGRDAGNLVLATPTAIFEGDIEAEIVDGAGQTEARPSTAADPYKLTQNTAALEGGLTIGMPTIAGGQETYSPVSGVIGIADMTPIAADIALTDDVPNGRVATTFLSPTVLSNLGTVSLNSTTSITIEDSIALADGGALTMTAPHIDIAANITARGGSVEATNIPVSRSNAFTDDTGAAGIILAPGVTIDTRGVWTNAFLGSSDLFGIAFVNGGAVTFDSTQSVEIGNGSLIDASAGAAILPNGSTVGGNGGDITLIANDPTLLDQEHDPKGLILDGTLRSIGVGKGGALTIESDTIFIGNASGIGNGVLSANTPAPGTVILAGDVVLPPGEKTPTSIILQNAITIPAGTQLPVGASYQAPEIVGPNQTILSTILMPGNNHDINPAGGCTGCLVTEAPWALPDGSGTVYSYLNDGASYVAYGPGQPAGNVVPANTTVWGGYGQLPAGYVVPADVFPTGVPVGYETKTVQAGGAAPVDIVIAAGTRLPAGVSVPAALTLPAGTTIPRGATLSSDAAVQPFVTLSPELFASGFSAYDISGYSGVTVADGTQLNVEMPVMRFVPGSMSVPTGADPAKALQLWTLPVYLADFNTGTIKQRAGASLTLTAMRSTVNEQTLLHDGLADQIDLAPIYIGKNSGITVDPGQAVKLDGWGEVDIEGDISAPSGLISIQNSRPTALNFTELTLPDANNPADLDPEGLSIWIGANSRLDVSASAFTATDLGGRLFGVAPNGGSIQIGGTNVLSANPTDTDAFIVIRPGAQLMAGGAQVTIDTTSGAALNATTAPHLVTVASDGSIFLGSISGIYNDGAMSAPAGGPGAAGGTLIVQLESPLYPGQQNTSRDIPDYLELPRLLTINSVKLAEDLPADLTAGVNDSSLVFGHADVGTDQLVAGGFGNVNLMGADVVQFSGNIDLAAAQSITLAARTFSLDPNTPDASVTIKAPYVLLEGPPTRDINQTSNDISYAPSSPSQQTATGTFTVNADQLDITNDVGFGGLLSDNPDLDHVSHPAPYDAPGFSNVTLNSSGDIRFISGVGSSAEQPTLSDYNDLTLNAAQIYPATGVSATIGVGDRTPASSAVLTFGRTTDTVPDTPYSIFGHLTLLANDIEQGGILRAPFGSIALGAESGATGRVQAYPTAQVNFLSGGITSVSAAGLIIPYGGTADGLSYSYDGQSIVTSAFGNANFVTADTNQAGILVDSASVDVQTGATLDLSGGGTLTGAGFISGRGGSTDILRGPLADNGPAYGAAGDAVYAILPNYTGGYAPIAPDTGAGQPTTGAQVTIPDGVPGLAAGTYTLLPSTYALLPGAFRIEVGGSAPKASGIQKLGDGSYITSGYVGVSGTGIRTALPDTIILSSADTVRKHSQYNETGYEDFAVQQAATVGSPTLFLPRDAAPMEIDFGSTVSSAPLIVDGTVLTTPADGGRASVVSVGDSTLPVEVIADDATPTPGWLSLRASSLSNLNSGALAIGGSVSDQTTGPDFFGATDLAVRSGADLSAAEIVLSAANISVEAGATVSTIGRGPAALSVESGYVFGQLGGIVLSNSPILVSDFSGSGTIGGAAPNIAVEDGASLLAGDTIAFDAMGQLSLNSANLGAKTLQVYTNVINYGDASALSEAQNNNLLPAGWNLSDQLFAKLAAGNPAVGAPALQEIDLTATGSLNLIGAANLSTIDPATGKSSVALKLSTPAIYGLGGPTDVATIATDTLIWNGVATGRQPTTYASAPPAAVGLGGPGTGSGALNIDVDYLILDDGQEYDATNETQLDRTMIGFSAVSITATQNVIANNIGSLSVYLTAANPAAANIPGQSALPPEGGSLNIVTPLLETGPGAVIKLATGGALSIGAPVGSSPADTSTVQNLGGEIDLSGSTVSIDSGIAAPSGKLVVEANGDINIGTAAHIDLSGRALVAYDATEYSWGGDADFESDHGDINISQGAILDVSATNNSAGSVRFSAVDPGAGNVSLLGQLLGAATDPGEGGRFQIAGQTIGDFDQLNTTLDAGGFFGARLFDLKQGSLTIHQTLRAHDVEVSVDAGDLTVNGTIDASSAKPGIIRLASATGLTLTSTAVLDVHGGALQTDSSNVPIDANNRGYIELNSNEAMLTLAAGATMDLSSPDGVARGDVELDAPRSGETGNSMLVSATGPLNIRGAATIALNGFWTYSLTGSAGVVEQDNGNGANGDSINGDGVLGLDQIDSRNRQFVDATLQNTAFLISISGLTANTDAFHIRPGVQIVSDGDLTTSGDLDFSGFRYSSINPNLQQSSVTGSGEPGTLVVRAGGNLNINGSVSDGFSPAPDAPIGQLTTVIHGLVAVGSNQPLSAGSSSIIFSATAVTVAPGNPGSVTVNPQDPSIGFSNAFARRPTVVSGTITGNNAANDPTAVDGPGTVVQKIWNGATLSPDLVLRFPGVADDTVVLSFGQPVTSAGFIAIGRRK